ncbi:MAG: isochorismatase [Verrucomicrobiota bacterium]
MDLPLPPHWEPETVTEVRRVPYEERAAGAADWASGHAITRARDDTRRVCLLLVDCQNTFCTPGFELFVPGAPDDNRRLCEFLYRNLGSITQVVPTLDTHRALQVFHAAWLVDGEGRRPPPYTTVSVQDVEEGVWRTSDPNEQAGLLEYVRALEAGGRYRLAVWPYHAMLGGLGHALVSAVEEAIFFHAIAREISPAFQIKGDDPRTEAYSVLGPEVGEDRNEALVELLRSFDAVIVAGQAKSHCVAWTVEDLLKDLPADHLYLLEDCMSPVVVAGAVDFTAEADEAIARFAERGVRVVRSTEAGWL